MIEFSEIVLRLGAATLIGGAIGINRDLHNKPTGVRTLGLVSLGSALVVLAGFSAGEANDVSALSRTTPSRASGLRRSGTGPSTRNDFT